jgi:hypothetical protein
MVELLQGVIGRFRIGLLAGFGESGGTIGGSVRKGSTGFSAAGLCDQAGSACCQV